MGLLNRLYRRFLLARHLPRHWQLRPGTIDRRVFRLVVIENEYQLPAHFAPDDVVLDVGGHIGSFTLAVLERGAGLVHCCEPDAENFRVLSHHLAPFGERVNLHHAAVWRSDDPEPSLALHNPFDPRNTAAGRVCSPESGARIQAIPFDDLIDRVTSDGRRVRLVKLDCEGAEWPILLTSRRLDRIETLCGEYHLGTLGNLYRVGDQTAFQPEQLVECLEQQGFRVRLEPFTFAPFPAGLFFAERG